MIGGLFFFGFFGAKQKQKAKSENRKAKSKKQKAKKQQANSKKQKATKQKNKKTKFNLASGVALPGVGEGAT